MFKILVVEDLREVYEPLCRILDDADFATEIATSQSEAIRLIEEKGGTYDLALVDLILGNDGHGYAVFREADQRGIPVIFLTALTDEYSMAEGYDRGAYDYICKPYKPIVLISRIKSVLRKSGKLQSELVCRDLVVDMSRAGDQKRQGNADAAHSLQIAAAVHEQSRPRVDARAAAGRNL